MTQQRAFQLKDLVERTMFRRVSHLSNDMLDGKVIAELDTLRWAWTILQRETEFPRPEYPE